MVQKPSNCPRVRAFYDIISLRILSAHPPPRINSTGTKVPPTHGSEPHRHRRCLVSSNFAYAQHGNTCSPCQQILCCVYLLPHEANSRWYTALILFSIAPKLLRIPIFFACASASRPTSLLAKHKNLSLCPNVMVIDKPRHRGRPHRSRGRRLCK